MIRSPRCDRITQGTIFCGGIADGYDGEPVWGIVITARCDTAHEKAPILNYLPVVRVEDWLHRDGGRLAISKAFSSTATSFKNLLSQRSLSHSLMEVYAPSILANTHFPHPTHPAANKKADKETKQASQARQLAAEYDELKVCLSDSPSLLRRVANALRRHPRAVRDIADSLVAHCIAGYYFVPNIGSLTEFSSSLGYVVNLREVRHLRRETAKLLLGGIERETAREMSISDLAFDPFDFACPVAETTSPWTEHLLQAFCNLFARIGVTDIDRSRALSIADAIAPTPKENV